MLTLTRVEQFGLSTVDKVKHLLIFHVQFLRGFCLMMLIVSAGSAVATGSKDCSILATDVETGSVIARLENAHEWVLSSFLGLFCFSFSYVICFSNASLFGLCRNPINTLINLSESTVATGDDEGFIKVPFYFICCDFYLVLC